MFLPKEKYIAYVQEIKASLASTKIKTYYLESIIGKINHATHIISLARYLLTPIFHLLKRGNNWGPQFLQSWKIQDLHIWINILQWFTDKSVPINNILLMIKIVKLLFDD